MALVGPPPLLTKSPFSVLLSDLRDERAATVPVPPGETRLSLARTRRFAEEPLPANDPLYDLHDDLAYNVTLTPHCSSLAPASWLRDSQAIWYNVHRLLRGEAVRWLVERREA